MAEVKSLTVTQGLGERPEEQELTNTLSRMRAFHRTHPAQLVNSNNTGSPTVKRMPANLKLTHEAGPGDQNP